MSEYESTTKEIPDDGKLQIVENLTLNLFSGQLRNDTTRKTVYLIGKQYGIFLFLSLRLGEVTTYDSITDHVWDERGATKDDLGERERIWQQIRSLREKLEYLETDVTITNHSQSGYSLSPIPEQD